MQNIVEDQQKLAAWVREQTRTLDMAVAFWGEGAIDQLRLNKKRDFRVVLDLSAGASNPWEVRKLLKLAPGRVKHLPRLHAKVYIGNSSVVVGSANASANGLGAEGYEATHWRELGLHSADPTALSECRHWFSRLFKEAEKIRDVDLDKAELAWANRRRTRPSLSTQDVVLVARERSAELHGRRIWVNVVIERMDPEDVEEMEAMGSERGTKLYGFTYFPEIPIAATMISFTHYDGRRLARDTPFICNTPTEKKRGKFKFVTPGNLGGYTLGKAGEVELRRRIDWYRKNKTRAWDSNGGLLFEITEFMRVTSPAVV